MPFNIFKRKQHKQQELDIPLFDEAFLRRLERLSLHASTTLRGVTLGERRSKKLRPSRSFSDHRPYSSGDDLRYVDWHAYGRHELLFVKLGETTQNINIHILLDCSLSMAWKPPKRPDSDMTNKWNVARRLAGTLAYLGLASGDRVKISSFAHIPGKSFGPAQGKRQVIPALRYLSAIKPIQPPEKKEESALTQVLTDHARIHSSGGLLIIISDLLDAAIPTNWEQGAEWLSRGLSHLPPPRWQVMIMHLLSEQEMKPEFKGGFDLRDMETQESLPIHFDKDTLEQYRQRVQLWCNVVQQACSQRGATYARIMSEWPLEKKVIIYLRQRGFIQ